jgi:protein-disulfide isomerase
VVGGAWPAVRGLVAALAVAASGAACKPSRGETAAAGAGSASASALTAPLGAEHCKALRDRLCEQFGEPSDECRMAEERVKSFPADRCLAMLSHYDETATAAARFVEGRRALVSPDQTTRHGAAPSIGNAGAPITMVLFADFDSPDCSRGSPIATVVRNMYQDKVRFVFRAFPSAKDLDSHLAAEAGMAAQAQGKFWRFYEVMFGNEHTHDRAALDRYAREAGLELGAFDDALDRHEFAADVEADRDLGTKVNVAQVPALFVNGKHVEFPYGAAELERVIADAR